MTTDLSGRLFAEKHIMLETKAVGVKQCEEIGNSKPFVASVHPITGNIYFLFAIAALLTHISYSHLSP